VTSSSSAIGVLCDEHTAHLLVLLFVKTRREEETPRWQENSLAKASARAAEAGDRLSSGGVGERSNSAVSKIVRGGFVPRGFKSLPLRSPCLLLAEPLRVRGDFIRIEQDSSQI
jgi:hypothetical protein